MATSARHQAAIRSQLPPGHDPGPLEPILNWVNPRFGPINVLSWLKHGAPEPGWWIYQCDLGRPLGKFHSSHAVTTSGCSLDGSEALKRALGEAVERYSGFNSLAFATLKTMRAGENPIVARLPRCAADEPCPDALKGLSDDTLLTHTPVTRLIDDAECWMPAGFVHLGFWPSEPEPYLNVPVTTGLSFQNNLANAIWSSLCEVAERDALMTFWWNQRAIPRIITDRGELPAALKERISRIAQIGVTPYLFDMSSDFRVPNVCCMLVSDERPHCVVGNSCDEDPVKACTGALDEAMCIRSYQVRIRRTVEIPSLEQFDWIKTFDDHANLYGAWKESPALHFLIRDNKLEIRFSDFCNRDWWQRPESRSELQDTAKHLQKLGLDVYYADLTLPEISEHGSCVKIIVPQMVPISVFDKIRWLGCERLQTGNTTRKSSRKDFNPFPQPFA